MVKVPATALNEIVVCIAALPASTLVTASYFVKFAAEVQKTKYFGDWMADFDGEF